MTLRFAPCLMNVPFESLRATIACHGEVLEP